MAFLELLRSAPNRTLSEVLRKLPQHGVGSLVTRDTWHPDSNKYWQIVEVLPLPDDPTKLNAWGYKYYKGERLNHRPKRIASVWKFGWTLKPAPESSAKYEALLARRQAAADAVAKPG